MARELYSIHGSVDPEERLLTFDWVEQERKWTVDIYLFRKFLESTVSVFVHSGFSLVSTCIEISKTLQWSLLIKILIAENKCNLRECGIFKFYINLNLLDYLINYYNAK